MAENTRRYRDSRTETLDASGNAEVFVEPQRHGLRYRITGVAVQVANTTLQPTAKVYEGSADASNFRSGTYDGANDSDNQLDIELYQGERITVRWEGGTPGAIATATFTGEETSGMA